MFMNTVYYFIKERIRNQSCHISLHKSFYVRGPYIIHDKKLEADYSNNMQKIKKAGGPK